MTVNSSYTYTLVETRSITYLCCVRANFLQSQGTAKHPIRGLEEPVSSAWMWSPGHAYVEPSKPLLKVRCHQLPTYFPFTPRPPHFSFCRQNSLLWIGDKNQCLLKDMSRPPSQEAFKVCCLNQDAEHRDHLSGHHRMGPTLVSSPMKRICTPPAPAQSSQKAPSHFLPR